MKKGSTKKSELMKRLNNKSLPLLTIDNRWYELFSYLSKTTSISSLEKKEKELVLKEARLNDEINEYRKEKKILMAKFIKNENSGIKAVNSKKEEKKVELDDYTKDIDRLNEKISNGKESLEKVKKELEKCNLELVVETMIALDEILLNNEKSIEDINKFIVQTKNEIKKQIMIKHDIKQEDKNIYSYMHNILGADIMQEFDGVTKYKISRIKKKNKNKKTDK